MEFVEGETLEKLIKRSGRLEIKLALEITSQVAAGLTAVHEQHLVHRDIKPSNIMVRQKEGGVVTAKIIDLGLAKPAADAPADAAISIPGIFAGTPEFASPEQFAGVRVDIRSDLYSLGVTLWALVTRQTPYRGSSAEVMYQHLHTPLPLEQLKDVTEPVVVLLEALLEKDPGRRFQNPAELLKAIPAVIDAIDRGRRITRQNLQKTPSAASRVGIRKPPVRPSPKKISIARLPVTGSDLFGREEDIAFLDDAWANKDASLVTIFAWAGVGKSTLVNHWLRRMAAEQYRSAELVFGWSFYRQGTSGGTSSADEFIDRSSKRRKFGLICTRDFQLITSVCGTALIKGSTRNRSAPNLKPFWSRKPLCPRHPIRSTTISCANVFTKCWLKARDWQVGLRPDAAGGARSPENLGTRRRSSPASIS
jgi:serine/threonine protein kinase